MRQFTRINLGLVGLGLVGQVGLVGLGLPLTVTIRVSRVSAMVSARFSVRAGLTSMPIMPWHGAPRFRKGALGRHEFF